MLFLTLERKFFMFFKSLKNGRYSFNSSVPFFIKRTSLPTSSGNSDKLSTITENFIAIYFELFLQIKTPIEV